MLLCAVVLLRNYSLTHSVSQLVSQLLNCVQGLSIALGQFHPVLCSSRCHSVMAAACAPLNHINGLRVESTNSNAEDDISVLEPATGQSTL